MRARVQGDQPNRELTCRRCPRSWGVYEFCWAHNHAVKLKPVSLPPSVVHLVGSKEGMRGPFFKPEGVHLERGRLVADRYVWRCSCGNNPILTPAELARLDESYPPGPIPL